MERYNIIDKRDRNAYNELKIYTLETLKALFKPEKEECPEEYEVWKQIADIEDLKDYLQEHVYGNGMEVPFIFIPE